MSILPRVASILCTADHAVTSAGSIRKSVCILPMSLDPTMLGGVLICLIPAGGMPAASSAGPARS